MTGRQDDRQSTLGKYMIDLCTYDLHSLVHNVLLRAHLL
jgi:hypothetical protein